LIFDADDTLWENNIFFEAAIEEFLEVLAGVICPEHPVARDRDCVRNLLMEIELESIPLNGYGSQHFINSLKETFRRIHNGADGSVYLQAIDQIGDRLLQHPVRLMPGVENILEHLRQHNRLMLLTKGDVMEQSGKVERSGLKDHFDEVEIVSEKDTAAYHALVERHALNRENTFMIGNSPRSDVLPALDAGLWAVFVPHEHTWELEHDEERLRFVQHIQPHPRLLVAQSLHDLPALLATVSGR
jgi:putative hydrolase of the HAD superfamily